MHYLSNIYLIYDVMDLRHSEPNTVKLRYKHKFGVDLLQLYY